MTVTSAARHTFKSRAPVERFGEQVRFYVKLRGKDYHKVMPMPRTIVSDVRQLAKSWLVALVAALPTLTKGIATEWKGIAKGYRAAVDRVQATELGPNDVYDDNPGFWLALRKLAGQLGALDQVMTRSDVLAWAVKDTLREHAETVQSHAAAVADAGRSAANAVAGAAGAIPTIAKALAVGAVGLGVYSVAKRK